jgi:aminoglycoside phosphotransferase (APT) family kinase protein
VTLGGSRPQMPMLEQHEVAAYLLQRRLISPRSIVSGRLRIADASSRNRNFRVSGGRGESYLLKQGLAADSAHTLANEVALYRRLAGAASWIPRLYDHDDGRGLLILEWIAGGEDLLRRGRVSPTLAAALGRVLADLHAVAPDEEELRRDAPWVLALHRPPLEAIRYLSAASVELVKLIQGDEAFARAMDELRDGWRAEALVHRDVKWANCIAHGAPGSARATRISLVDWEMAGWGDPAFDIGSAFSECVGSPAVAQALWRAYAQARKLEAAAAAELVERAIGYAGARLVQTAYEHTQEVRVMSVATGRDVQVGRRMLVAPREAVTELLGVAA